MFRVDRELLRKLYAILHWIPQDDTQETVNNIREVIAEDYERDRWPEGAIRTEMRAFLRDDSLSLSEIKQLLENMLNTTETTDGTSSLIDALVEVVQRNLSVNRVGPDLIRGIRHALLLPHEAYAMAERLQAASEVACFSCGHQFQPNEHVVTVIRLDPGRPREVAFSCQVCNRNCYRPCAHPGCQEALPAPTPQLDYCPEHQTKATKGLQVTSDEASPFLTEPTEWGTMRLPDLPQVGVFNENVLRTRPGVTVGRIESGRIEPRPRTNPTPTPPTFGRRYR